jgi:hypothetical protein
MSESGLMVATQLPFACSPGSLDAAQQHGSRLLIRVVNMLDQHEQEPDKPSERVEAKLDLMLHWLGMHLFASGLAPARTQVWLAGDRIEWLATVVPQMESVVLSLHIHPAMAAPLKLEARIVGHGNGRVTARLEFDDEAYADAWTQWLFRCHRRAVHESRSRTGA